jgi:hypothetical protein
MLYRVVESAINRRILSGGNARSSGSKLRKCRARARRPLPACRFFLSWLLAIRYFSTRCNRRLANSYSDERCEEFCEPRSGEMFIEPINFSNDPSSFRSDIFLSPINGLKCWMDRDGYKYFVPPGPPRRSLSLDYTTFFKLSLIVCRLIVGTLLLFAPSRGRRRQILRVDSELPFEKGGTNSTFPKKVSPSAPESIALTSRTLNEALAMLGWRISKDWQ